MGKKYLAEMMNFGFTIHLLCHLDHVISFWRSEGRRQVSSSQGVQTLRLHTEQH